MDLHRRRCATSPFCPRCLSIKESIEHLPFFCNHAKASWFKSSLDFSPNSNYFRFVVDWLSSLSSLCISADKKELKLASFLCWFFWKSRNDFIFNFLSPNPVHAIQRSQNAVDELQSLVIPKLHSQSSSTFLESKMNKWLPPC